MARCLRYDSHMKEIERKEDVTCLPLGRRRRKRKLAAEEQSHSEVDENKASGEMPLQNKPKQRRAAPQPLGVATSVKINPLFLPSAATHTTSRREEGEEGEEEEEEEEREEEKGEVFYSQLKNIRRTKEKEMIAAVADLAKYGEKTVGSRNDRKRSKLAEKVRTVALRRRRRRGRSGRAGKHKPPTARPRRGRAFYLRAPLRSTQQL